MPERRLDQFYREALANQKSAKDRFEAPLSEKERIRVKGLPPHDGGDEQNWEKYMFPPGHPDRG